MNIQDKNGNNRIFIDDEFREKEIALVSQDKNFATIKCFTRDIQVDNFILHDIEFILYDYNNRLRFYHPTCSVNERKLKENEIISIGYNEDKSLLLIEIIELPSFVLDENSTYPKFEINLSDCQYSMRIFVDNNTYLDIPVYKSHETINATLDYIYSLVFYLTEARPDFMINLFNNSLCSLIIKDKDGNSSWGCDISYKLGPEYIYLTGGELDNYQVEYHKFFKLVMDGRWEIEFE